LRRASPRRPRLENDYAQTAARELTCNGTPDDAGAHNDHIAFTRWHHEFWTIVE
jgi:hypothetical protein